MLLLASLLPLLGAPALLRAQAEPAATGPSMSAISPAAVTRAAVPCSYAECALRVEPSFISGPHLVRGTMGSNVADLGSRSTADLSRLFAGNDSATTYSREYVQAARANTALTFTGIVLGAVGLAQSRRMNAYTAVGASMLVVSIPYQLVEQRTLSRAVWWYNAALSGSPAEH